MNKNHKPSNVPTLDLIISASKAYHKPCPAKNCPKFDIPLYSSLNLLETTLNSHQPSKIRNEKDPSVYRNQNFKGENSGPTVHVL